MRTDTAQIRRHWWTIRLALNEGLAFFLLAVAMFWLFEFVVGQIP
jgi:hypothetical protein